MPLTATDKIWIDGEFVDWDKAQIHVLTHSLHYGSGVFEGIRAYPTPAGVAVFRLTEHIQRLFMSAKILMIDVPFSLDQLVAATKEQMAVTTKQPLVEYVRRSLELEEPEEIERRADELTVIRAITQDDIDLALQSFQPIPILQR